MIYCIALIHCPDPHRVLREAVVPLPGLAEALAPREVELPDGEREGVVYRREIAVNQGCVIATRTREDAEMGRAFACLPAV